MCRNTKTVPENDEKPAQEEPLPSAATTTSSSPPKDDKETMAQKNSQKNQNSSMSSLRKRRHRGQRESYANYSVRVSSEPPEAGSPATDDKTTTENSQFIRRKPKKQSKAKQKHGADNPSGGIEALLPSLIGLAILGCGLLAKLGFRGRAEVAGIDLGTTNSVICVQAPSKGVGVIDCMVDPTTNSSIIPSVVSFLEPSERPVGAKSKTPSKLIPHPSGVVVGQAAKKRIDSHPHHTLYNAKRVLGRPPTDRAIQQLQDEVEFQVHVQPARTTDENNNDNDDHESQLMEDQRVVFQVPHHTHANQPSEWMSIAPQQVGSYVVSALLQFTHQQLGHENVKAAVICVPAKFDTIQRQRTVAAFQEAGVKVTRILEEPTAAALAYGLHLKDGVDYIIVYDFGGGTLDISLLHVSNGFVDVMGSDGDDRLGGADFDAVIAHYWLEEQHKEAEGDRTANQVLVDDVSAVLHQLEALLEDTPQHLDFEQELSSHCPAILEHPLCTVSSFHTLGEQIKIRLSDTYDDEDATVLETHCWRLPEGTKSIPTQDDPLAMVDSFCASLTKATLTLSRDEFQQAAQPLLERSILPVQRLLNDLSLTTNDIDEVVMVGGTTRMPQIRALVREELSASTLNTHIDPDITVAYGAASVID